MGFSRKDKAKRLVEKELKLGIDYKLLLLNTEEQNDEEVFPPKGENSVGESLEDAGEQMNISPNYIRRVCIGARNQTGGFSWKWKEE